MKEQASLVVGAPGKFDCADFLTNRQVRRGEMTRATQDGLGHLDFVRSRYHS